MVKYNYLFYDGECGFCRNSVRFFALKDRSDRFLFASKQGEKIKSLVSQDTIDQMPDSIVFFSEEEELFYHSSAVVQALKTIGGAWGVIGRVIELVPKAIRDYMYKGVAKRRETISKVISCDIMPKEIKHKFID